MADIEGTLYCSTPQLEKVFRCNRSQLLHVCSKWRHDEFGNATVGDLVMSNQHRKGLDGLPEALLLKRLQPKTRLWSEDDVLSFAFALRSDIARHCRAEFKDILKRHARREMVPREQLDKMLMTCSDLADQVSQLWSAVQDLQKQREPSRPVRDFHLVKG